MTSPREFEGLFEHNVRYLGNFRYAEPADDGTRNRGYDLAFFDQEEYKVTSVVTNGLRFQDIDALFPEELICTLHTGQEGFAHHLVNLTAGLVIRNRRGLEYDSVFMNESPLIEGTQICGVLGYPSPFFGPEFDLFYGSDAKRPELQTVTLIPVTKPEAEYAAENSPDELWDIWKANATNILDINRSSVV
ncbi:suppressor of fused domain protein [Nocardia heshunensis]